MIVHRVELQAGEYESRTTADGTVFDFAVVGERDGKATVISWAQRRDQAEQTAGIMGHAFANVEVVQLSECDNCGEHRCDIVLGHMDSAICECCNAESRRAYLAEEEASQ